MPLLKQWRRMLLAIVFMPWSAAVSEEIKVKRRSLPVAVDNDFSIWHAWHNRAWPIIYLVDKKKDIRCQQIGESSYKDTERMIRQQLAE